MSMIRSVGSAAVMAAALWHAGATARADVVLTPSSTVNITSQGAIVGIGPLAPGSSTITNQASLGGSAVSATLSEAVYTDLGGGLGFAGGTIFAFQITNTGTAALQALSVSNYDAYATAVGTLTAAPGSFPGGTAGTVSPTSATRSLDGNTITFNFGGNGLAIGTTSNVFYVRTNAPSYNNFGGGLTAGFGPGVGTDVFVNLLQPTAAIPEPGPLMLASAGLPLFLGLSWIRRRLRPRA